MDAFGTNFQKFIKSSSLNALLITMGGLPLSEQKRSGLKERTEGEGRQWEEEKRAEGRGGEERRRGRQN